jgi:exopolysaccharide production protein ExoZ
VRQRTIAGAIVTERQSLLSIQILRAFAALAVTCDHIAGYEFTRQYGLPDALPHVKFGGAGVDLFFVISGLVMVYASDSYFGRARAPQEFFLRRLVRIVPLYWAMTTIVLVYLFLQYRDLARANFSPASVVASYLFIPWPQVDGFMAPVHGVGWTLNYEMLFYALFALAVLFTRRTGVLLLAALLFAFVIFNYFVSLPLPLGYWANPIVLEFVFGMLIALALHSGFRIPRAWAAAIVLAGCVALVASDHWPDVHRIFALGLPSAFIVGALALADHTAKPAFAWRALSFLGDASYSLYLVHPLAITLPRRLFPYLVDPATPPWLYAGLLLTTAVSAAIAVHLTFERPITRYLQRRIVSRFHREKLEAAPAGAG